MKRAKPEPPLVAMRAARGGLVHAGLEHNVGAHAERPPRWSFNNQDQALNSKLYRINL